MHKKFVVNQTKIKGGCQWERKTVEMISYSKMPLQVTTICKNNLSAIEVYKVKLAKLLLFSAK